MNTSPRVSIGLPVRNGSKYLVQALDALLKQDYEDFEIVISDNASDDATPDICRSYEQSDKRIRLFRQAQNVGAAQNFNDVFHLARGEFFCWSGHDDLREPTFVSSCVSLLEDHPQTVLAYPRSVFIDGEGAILRPDTDHFQATAQSPTVRLRSTLWSLSRANAVLGLIRADALKRTRLIDNFIASDYVLLVELSLLGHIREHPDVLLQRRIHEGSSTNRPMRERESWFDPARHPDILGVRNRLMLEYIRSVRRLVPDPTQRWLCTVSVPQVMWTRQLRTWLGRLRRRLSP